MKKTVLVAVATALLVSACTTTDPYTGDQKISNTAAGAGLGALAGASLGRCRRRKEKLAAIIARNQDAHLPVPRGITQRSSRFRFLDLC